MGVLAPLTPSQAQLLATLDSYRIRDESEVFAELSERLENLLKELQEELAARQEFEYLPPEEAQQAAALRLKQIRGTMTQAELDQVRTLQNREEEIHSEFVRHIANPALRARPRSVSRSFGNTARRTERPWTRCARGSRIACPSARVSLVGC